MYHRDQRVRTTEFVQTTEIVRTTVMVFATEMVLTTVMVHITGMSDLGLTNYILSILIKSKTLSVCVPVYVQFDYLSVRKRHGLL